MSDNDDRREQPGEDPDQGQNPWEALFSGFGMGQPGQPGQSGQPNLQQLMQQLQQLFGQFGMGGIIGGPGADPQQERWQQIRDVARRTVAASGTDPSPSHDQLTALRDAVRLADMWLDETCDFSGTGTVAVWSRAEWVENSMPTWRRLIDPVAESMSEAMADSVAPEDGAGAELLGLPGLQGLEAMLRPWLKHSGAAVFGVQAGQAIGSLAASVVGATETGLPLSGEHAGSIALVPTNVTAFAEGLEQNDADVLLYLSLREAARQRLFGTVSWLGPAILGLVEQYARGISIDLSSVEEAVGEIDLNSFDPQAFTELSDKLQGSMFAPRQTPEQLAVLRKLETLLALVEGWVDEVVGQATARWMPTGAALAEVVRRRRATGGPTEATFAALVGLELRPRRLRDAANLWAALREDRGIEARDAIWRHPDLLPTAEDLDDPLGYVAGEREQGATAPAGDDLDAELEKLLDQADRERGDTDE